MQTEAIFAARGKEMDDSKYYDQNKLISWIEKNLPSMLSLESIRKMRSQQSYTAPYLKNNDTDATIESKQRGEQKHIGRSMFIINNDS